MSKFRTDIENLFLEELVEEDATFLVNGFEDNADDIIASNTDQGLFDDTSSEDGFEDSGELFDEEDDDLEENIFNWR